MASRRDTDVQQSIRREPRRDSGPSDASLEELDISTIAVYSDADTDAGHVQYADEVYNGGPARAADSYLNHDAIMDVAQRSGADAIRPGYGFLAENAEFAAKVEETKGLIWVGPSADAMGRLGEKISASRLMDDTDIPIVRGTTEPVKDSVEVEAFRDEHGYSVAIKVEGGGGVVLRYGRGGRISG